MSYYLVYITAGFFNSLTPGGLVFLLITIALPIAGIFLKKRVLVYASLFILAVILFLNLSVPIPLLTYIGPIQATLLIDGSFIDKLIHNVGLIFVPLVVSLIALRLSGKSSHQ